MPQTPPTSLRHAGAHLSGQHDRCHGARRSAADCGVRVPVRHGLRGDRREGRPVVEFCDSLSEVMFRYTNYVMYLAPLGVGGAMAHTIGEQRAGRVAQPRQAGADAVRRRRSFFVVWCWARWRRSRAFRCGRFVAPCASLFVIAFSTASSEAALPLALENMEQLRRAETYCGVCAAHRLQLQSGWVDVVSCRWRRFSSRRRRGSTCPSARSCLMMLTLMLTSKGVAGVPRASLVILAGTLATFGLARGRHRGAASARIR